MSVALVMQSYEAFARDDMDAVLAHVHPDIVWHQAQGLPHGGVYRGIDKVRSNVFDPLDRDWWAEFVVTPDEFIEDGQLVVVLEEVATNPRVVEAYLGTSATERK